MSKELFNNLETIWNTDEHGIEFVYARDLQKTLGYNKWENFETVIKKAMITCESNGNPRDNHFPGVRNMVSIGSNTKREVQDYKLTRYACYLTAQNGDPRKEEIAFAQNYFAVQTRKFELVEQRKKENDRVLERKDLQGEEKIFSDELYQRGVDHQGFARIRSKGDEALFGGNTTKDMKMKLGVPEKHMDRPLADFLDPIAITAKKLATQVSNRNVKDNNIYGEKNITEEHILNNSTFRDALLKRGITPEKLPPSEDIKKVESRLNKEVKTIKTRIIISAPDNENIR